jgi:hypothetical protein
LKLVTILSRDSTLLSIKGNSTICPTKSIC